MPGKIINIRGSNGSGKTHLMKSIIALSNDKYLLMRDGKPYATILNDLQYCIVGYYHPDKGMGGADGIHTMVELLSIIDELVEHYPGWYVAVEGMMISTTTTTYKHMLELAKSHGIIPFVVVLKSSVEGCLKRLEQRRGSPLEHTELVAQKCELVLKHQYQPGHVAYLDVDATPKEQMLPTFLQLVGDELTASYIK